MFRSLQASLRQRKGFVLPERLHNLWVHYFTASTPKNLSNAPKNSPLSGHYSNFNFSDINMKILSTESSAIEANPEESLPLLLHFEQPISPHYFKFCVTLETMKLDKVSYKKVSQEVGPQLMRAVIAFTFQLKKNYQDIMSK